MKAKGKQFIFQSFIFELLFIFINNECNRSTPIKFNDGPCELRFCSAEEIRDGQCVIDNEIVKTQYLNEIINLDAIHDNSKFHLTKYSNGSLVSIISYSIPPESFRQFYGLNNNEDRFLLENKVLEIEKDEDNKENEEGEDNKEDEGGENNKENEKDEEYKEDEKDEEYKEDEKDEEHKENEGNEEYKEDEKGEDNKEEEKEEEYKEDEDNKENEGGEDHKKDEENEIKNSTKSK